MEKADDQKFAGLMAMLSTALGKENTELKVEVYYGALKDFSIKDVEQAVYLAIKTLKFFPKIAELRELIEGDPESRALMAWRIAVDERDYYHSIEFDDPIIHYCIVELFGDWMSFCEKTLDELKWEEKRFLNLYQLALRRSDLITKAPRVMVGFFNQDNEGKAFLEHVPPVRKIETRVKEVKKIEPPKIKELPKEV